MIAEKALLGTMIKENHLFLGSELEPEHFSETVHKNIFRAMKDLSHQNKSVDVTGLLIHKDPKELGGANYLRNLQNYANEQKFEEYTAVILEKWQWHEKNRLIQLAGMEDWDIGTIVGQLSSLETNRVDDHSTIDELIADVYEDPFIEKPPQIGVPTGVRKLDEMTNGWQESELNIIAARPSMGKTDVILHAAKEAGWAGYLPIIFSLEMKDKRLTERLIASIGKYSRSKMRDPYRLLSDAQKNKWSETTGRLAATKIQIFDDANQTLSIIKAKIRKAMQICRDRKPIIFIDYLTLIKPAENLGSNHLQIGAITKGLKALAKEFECPVVVLAQLSREVEKRADKRPGMADIRESGSIEEDADTITFLYRDSYYEKNDNALVDMEFIVAKNRNGPTGTIITGYNKFTGEVFSDANSPTAAV